MAEDAGSIYSDVRIRIDKLGSDIITAQEQIKKMGATIDKLTAKDSEEMAKNYKKGFDQINLGAAGLAAGATLAFKGLVDTFAKTEQSLANVRAVTGASASDFDRLKKAAVDAGDKTRFSASQAADAMYFLASGGLDASQSISALNGVLLLAGATGSELADTSATLTATISQFGLEASSAGDIANTFAAAIGNSQATMDKLAVSLRSVGPVAGTLGVGLEETTASLQALYNAGFTGETAGTALRNILLDLSNRTGPVVEKLAQVGITFDQINPQKVGLTGAIEALGASAVSNTDLMSIFGKESAAQLGTLLEAAKSAGKDGLRPLEEAITGTNKAAEQYAIQNDTLAGSLDEFSSKAETASNRAGEALTPSLRGLLGVGGAILGFLSSLPAGLTGAVTGFAVMAGSVLALNGAIGVLGLSMGALLGPVALVAGAIGLVAVGFSAAGDSAKKAQEAYFSFQDTVKQAETGKLAGDLNSQLKQTQALLEEVRKKYKENFDIAVRETKAQRQGYDVHRIATEESIKLKDQEKGLMEAIGRIQKELADQAKAATPEMIAQTAETQKKKDIATELLAIEKLRQANLISEGEELEKKLAISQQIAKAIEDQVLKTGNLSTAQTEQLKAENAKIEEYKARLAELDALKEASGKTELEKRKETLALIEDEEARALEAFKVGLDEKAIALEAAGATETEIATYKADQLSAYEAKKVEDRDITLQALTSLEEQDQARFDADLLEKTAKLKAAGATEEELAKYTADQIAAYNKKKQDEGTQAWLTGFNAKAKLATEFAGAINSLYQQLLANQVEDIKYETKKKTEALDAEFKARKEAGEDKETLDKEYATRKAKIESDSQRELAQIQYQGAVADWWMKQANLLASAPGVILTASTQLGPIAGPIVGGVIVGAQEAALLAAYPKPPRFETGGLVIGSGGSNGTNVTVAENGTDELLFNSGATGRDFRESFAAEVAARVSQRVVVELDGRVVAESTVGYINNGQVRVL